MVSDRSVLVRLKGDVNPFIREFAKASAATKAFTKELDTATDRSTMFTQSLLAITPAAVPITAAAIPAISGLTNQLAFATAGAGVAVLAFQGVGDALKATNDYAIEPTDANLQKMQQSLSELGPAGREFVGFLQEIRPQLQGLQDVAQEGLFPGAQAGIEDLMTRLPQVERIFGVLAKAGGDMLAEAGANLASPEWNEFFDFLESEARPTLVDFSRSLGNLGEGFANLWMAFDPLSDQFSDSFLQMSRDFSAWTDGLDQTEGFQEFVEYINRVGPKAWDTLGSVGNALLQLVEAAAPVGEVMLPAIEALADTIAVLADSDLAPLAIGMVSLTSAYSRVIALTQTANSSAIGGLFGKSTYAGAAQAAKDVPAATRAYMDFGAALDSAGPKAGKFATTADRLGAALRGGGTIAAGAGGLAFVMSDLDDKMGLSNAAMGAMAGSLVGPWGTAIGAGVGLAMDFAAANDDVWAALDRVDSALAGGPSNLEQQKLALEDARESLKAFQDDIDKGSKMNNLNPADWFKSTKNAWEGAFGRSDVEEATDALKERTDAVADSEREVQDLLFAENGLGSSMDGATKSAREEMQAIIDLRNEHNRTADAALASRDAENAYEAAIDNAAESVKQNGKTLDKHTEAGRANRAAVDDIITTFNNMDYATQQSNGGMKAAREEYVKASVAAGGASKEARQLAIDLLKPKSPPPIKITAEDRASDVIASIQAARDRLNDKTFTITTRRLEQIFRQSGDDKGNTARAPRGFTGMRVPDGYAAGGRIPGTPPSDPTLDNIFGMTAKGNPLMLRSREWIINEPQSDKNDRWLRAINNGLNMDDLFGPMAIPGFAAGGRADGAPTKLEIKEAEARVRDLERSLAETETVKRDGKKVKRKVLRGLDEEIARLQLAEAKKDLADLKNGTEAKVEAAEKAKEDADKAADILKEAADKAENDRLSAKSSAASLFSIGSSTSAAQVDRNLTRLLNDANTFLGLLGDLKGKGASPWLLGELVKAGPTPGAIKLAREYNTNQAALDNINARASQIDSYTNAYAGLVGNAQFMAPGAWNSGVSSASQAGATIVQNIYPAAGMSEANMADIIGGQLAWRMN